MYRNLKQILIMILLFFQGKSQIENISAEQKIYKVENCC